MKLHLASFGGIGGLRIDGPLDTEDLTPDLAATARRLVALAALDREPERGETRSVPDGLGYELSWSVEEAPGRDVTHRRLFSEQNAPPEALDSLQALMREIVRRKAASRGGHTGR